MLSDTALDAWAYITFHLWIVLRIVESWILKQKQYSQRHWIEKSREKFNRKEKNNGIKGRSDIKMEFEPFFFSLCFARPSWRKHKHTYTNSIQFVFLLIWQNQFKSQELIIDRNATEWVVWNLSGAWMVCL